MCHDFKSAKGNILKTDPDLQIIYGFGEMLAPYRKLHNENTKTAVFKVLNELFR